MPESMVTLLTNILIAVAIGAAGYLLAWITARLLKKVLSRLLNLSWSGFLANLAAFGIMILTIKIIVDQTGATGAFVVIVTALTGAFALGSNELAADLVQQRLRDTAVLRRHVVGMWQPQRRQHPGRRQLRELTHHRQDQPQPEIDDTPPDHHTPYPKPQ